MRVAAGSPKQAVLLPADRFWTGIVQIPRLRSSLTGPVLLHEIAKTFPAPIESSDAIRWECLDSLFGQDHYKSSSYLVFIPYGAPPLGLAPMQILVRIALAQTNEVPCLLVAQGVQSCEALYRNSDGVVTYQQLPGHEIPGLVASNNAGKASPVLVLRAEASFHLDAAGGKVTYLDAANLNWGRLQKYPLRNDGSHGERHWKRIAMLGVGFCFLAGAILLGRAYMQKVDELRDLKSGVTGMQKKMQIDAASNLEKSRLVGEIEQLQLAQAVQLYQLLQRVVDQLGASNRILMVRWDGSARTLQLELASTEAVRLLDSLDRSGIFRKLASTGMTPLPEDVRYMRLTVTGYLEAVP